MRRLSFSSFSEVLSLLGNFGNFFYLKAQETLCFFEKKEISQSFLDFDVSLWNTPYSFLLEFSLRRLLHLPNQAFFLSFWLLELFPFGYPLFSFEAFCSFPLANESFDRSCSWFSCFLLGGGDILDHLK